MGVRSIPYLGRFVNLSSWMIVLVPGGLLIVLLAFITLNRYIRYKERVALAQLGLPLEDLDRQESRKNHGNRGVLWGGVITATSGMALYLGLATIGTGVWLLGGLLPAFVGAGMILIYFMTLGASSRPNEPDQILDETEALEEIPDLDETSFLALDEALSEPVHRVQDTREDQ